MMQERSGIQLALPSTRIGVMGGLDLGHDYLARVKARARKLTRACAIKRRVARSGR
jgi:hypothetical protein